MNKVFALYFSGTGNTKYAVKKLCHELSSQRFECHISSIEDFDSGKKIDADIIVVGYPIYGSCLPRPMKEFLEKYALNFAGKKLITLATQYFWSGDGGALATRLLKKQGITFTHSASIHINMPNNICDTKIMKVKNGQEIESKVKKADKKIEICAKKIKAGKNIKNGRRFFSRSIGFLSQRCYFGLVEKKLMRSLKVLESLCVACKQCVNCCPVKNLELKDGKVIQHNNCAFCYRCANLCPQKAISLMGKNPPSKQYKGISKVNEERKHESD